ncbi:MAG: hypothetical protein MJ252_08140 [archaeon]|nr:hypothetical protein [archaeon]
MLKNVETLLKSVGDTTLNRKNREEAILAISCYGKIVINSNNKKSVRTI